MRLAISFLMLCLCPMFLTTQAQSAPTIKLPPFSQEMALSYIRPGLLLSSEYESYFGETASMDIEVLAPLGEYIKFRHWQRGTKKAPLNDYKDMSQPWFEGAFLAPGGSWGYMQWAHSAEETTVSEEKITVAGKAFECAVYTGPKSRINGIEYQAKAWFPKTMPGVCVRIRYGRPMGASKGTVEPTYEYKKILEPEERAKEKKDKKGNKGPAQESSVETYPDLPWTASELKGAYRKGLTFSYFTNWYGDGARGDTEVKEVSAQGVKFQRTETKYNGKAKISRTWDFELRFDHLFMLNLPCVHWPWPKDKTTITQEKRAFNNEELDCIVWTGPEVDDGLNGKARDRFWMSKAYPGMILRYEDHRATVGSKKFPHRYAEIEAIAQPK